MQVRAHSLCCVRVFRTQGVSFGFRAGFGFRDAWWYHRWSVFRPFGLAATEGLAVSHSGTNSGYKVGIHGLGSGASDLIPLQPCNTLA